VVMIIIASDYGADVCPLAVRHIWDGVYGHEGHPAALPGGLLPSSLRRAGPAPGAGRAG